MGEGDNLRSSKREKLFPELEVKLLDFLFFIRNKSISELDFFIRKKIDFWIRFYKYEISIRHYGGPDNKF